MKNIVWILIKWVSQQPSVCKSIHLLQLLQKLFNFKIVIWSFHSHCKTVDVIIYSLLNGFKCFFFFSFSVIQVDFWAIFVAYWAPERWEFWFWALTAQEKPQFYTGIIIFLIKTNLKLFQNWIIIISCLSIAYKSVKWLQRYRQSVSMSNK